MWLQTEPAPPDDHMSAAANPWDTAWTAMHPASVLQQAGSTEHEHILSKLLSAQYCKFPYFNANEHPAQHLLPELEMF